MDLAVMSRHVAGLVRGKLPVGEMTSPVESEEEVALGLPKVDAIEFGEIGALVEDKFEFSPWDPFNANYVLSQRQEIIDRRQETVRARCNKDSAHDDLNPVA